MINKIKKLIIIFLFYLFINLYNLNKLNTNNIMRLTTCTAKYNWNKINNRNLNNTNINNTNINNTNKKDILNDVRCEISAGNINIKLVDDLTKLLENANAENDDLTKLLKNADTENSHLTRLLENTYTEKSRLTMIIENNHTEITFINKRNAGERLYLEQQIAELLTDDTQCSICMSQKKNAAFVACGHLCACTECAEKCHGVCPLCKTKGSFIKIYQ